MRRSVVLSEEFTDDVTLVLSVGAFINLYLLKFAYDTDTQAITEMSASVVMTTASLQACEQLRAFDFKGFFQLAAVSACGMTSLS